MAGLVETDFAGSLRMDSVTVSMDCRDNADRLGTQNGNSC